MGFKTRIVGGIAAATAALVLATCQDERAANPNLAVELTLEKIAETPVAEASPQETLKPIVYQIATNPEDIVYRDKGYTGTKVKAVGNGTMKRGNLTPHEKFRNYRIQKLRSQGEHPYATVKRAMHGGQTRLTTVSRVFVQQLFVFAAYNLFRLTSLVKI